MSNESISVLMHAAMTMQMMVPKNQQLPILNISYVVPSVTCSFTLLHFSYMELIVQMHWISLARSANSVSLLPHQNPIRNGFGRIGCFFGHVHAAIEPADGPDGTQPAEKPGKARRPSSQVCGGAEDEFAVVSLVFATDGQSYDGGCYEDEVCAE